MPTLHDQLSRIAKTHPDGAAVIHDGVVRTWSELTREVDSVATGLLRRGIRRGDRIAIWLPNVPEWTILWLAAGSIGAAVVPLNTRYRPAEVEYVLRQSGSSMLITLPTLLGIDFRAMTSELVGEQAWDSGTVEESARFPALRHLLHIDDATGPAAYASLAVEPDTALLAQRRLAVAESDDLILVYTSGTTGFPKGARHAHTALSDVRAMADLMGVTEADRILAHMPNFHVGGAFLSIVSSLVTGAAQVCLPAFEPRTALRLIAEHSCSVVNGVPSHFIMMLTALDESETYDLSSARIGWIAGAMIPREVVLGIRERLGMDLLTMYGMTETTGVTTATRPGRPARRAARLRRHPGRRGLQGPRRRSGDRRRGSCG